MFLRVTDGINSGGAAGIYVSGSSAVSSCGWNTLGSEQIAILFSWRFGPSKSRRQFTHRLKCLLGFEEVFYEFPDLTYLCCMSRPSVS